MNAIEILVQQHGDVEGLFKEYEQLIRSNDDPQVKRALFTEIADQLSEHMEIEERHFYPALMSEDSESILRRSAEEHLSAKRIIADLLELEVTDPTYDAKVETLIEQVRMHIREEERVVFNKFARRMEAGKLEELGAKMENTLAELMAQGNPRLQVQEETERAAPLD